MFNEKVFKMKIRQELKEALMIGPMNEIEGRINDVADNTYKRHAAYSTASFFLGIAGLVIGQLIWRLF